MGRKVRRGRRPKHQPGRETSHGGETAEDQVERHLVVAEPAEADVGQAAARDAGQVHEAVAGGALVGPGDLREDRHVVAVEEAPAQAEEHEEGDGQRERALADDDADAEQRRDDEAHAEGADLLPAPRRTTHPAVRQPAAAQRAQDGGALPPHHGADAGQALGQPEVLLEDARHPVAHDPAGQRGEGEVQQQQPEIPVAQEFAHGDVRPRRRRRRVPRGVPQPPPERQRVGHAEQA
jgi:hypothetical protein